MGRTAYDVETKRKAIELSGRIGPENTAQQMGIPPGTVRAWVSKYRPGALKMIEFPQAEQSDTWENRKPELTDRSGAVALQAIATAERLLAEGRPADALSSMRVSDYATKQAQLLSGGATDRRESRTFSLTASLGRLAQILLPDSTDLAAIGNPKGLPIPADLVPDLPERADDHSPSHQTGAIPADG